MDRSAIGAVESADIPKHEGLQVNFTIEVWSDQGEYGVDLGCDEWRRRPRN
ncbi:hypothetical protein NX059_010704 [Plenodomus lindquistii]|nr:hypothetical protein NX059_010704 [Plenodomus lindquistii]